MAYIDIKVESAPVRIIIFSGKLHTPSGEDVSSLSGYSAELMATNKRLLYSVLDGIPTSGNTYINGEKGETPGPFERVRQIADKKGFPMLVPESLVIEEKVAELTKNEFVDTTKGPVGLWMRLAYTLAGFKDPGSLNRSDRTFRIAERSTRWSAKLNPVIVELRDLLIAQKTQAFLRMGLVTSTEEEPFGVGIGSGHLGVIAALELPEEERVRKIQEFEEKISKYYQRGNFHKGYFVVLGSGPKGMKKWYKKEFADKNLNGLV